MRDELLSSSAIYNLENKDHVFSNLFVHHPTTLSSTLKLFFMAECKTTFYFPTECKMGCINKELLSSSFESFSFSYSDTSARRQLAMLQLMLGKTNTCQHDTFHTFLDEQWVDFDKYVQWLRLDWAETDIFIRDKMTSTTAEGCFFRC